MTQTTPDPQLAAANRQPNLHAIGYIRWTICGLLFLATTVNYIDRSIIGFLKKPLSDHFHWDERDYANIITAFQFAYAFGYLLGGRLMDLLGVKRGFPLILGFWSLATAAHGLVTYVNPDSQWAWGFHVADWTFNFSTSVICFGLLRLALGLSEGGNFPASVKTVGEWFPIKERALATGIFNCGSTLGPVFCPLLVPWINKHWGWEATFYVTGALGFAWIALWWLIYETPERHRHLSEAERVYIQSGRPAAEPQRRIPWLSLLAYRETWAFVIGILLTSPVWWFFIFWIPDFFQKKFKIEDNFLPVAVVFLITLPGSIGGGWIPAWLLRRGMSLNASRKIAMLVCALCVVPVFLAPLAPNLWLTVIITGIAAAAHQGWAANLYTLVSDTMPKQAVSSVVGIGGLAAGLASVVTAQIVGFVLQSTGNYFVLFAGASAMYLIALLAIQLLCPQIKMITLSEAPGFKASRGE